MKTTLHLILTFLLAFSVLLTSDGYCEEISVTNSVDVSHEFSDLNDRILGEAYKHIGVRYKRGGSSGAGMDCSGFVRLMYRHIFKVDLPYTAAAQSDIPLFQDIPFETLRTGDLIFFSRTPERKYINHVGIYLKEGDFAHAIESKGVTISNLSETHWKIRVTKTRRIKIRRINQTDSHEITGSN